MWFFGKSKAHKEWERQREEETRRQHAPAECGWGWVHKPHRFYTRPFYTEMWCSGEPAWAKRGEDDE